MAANVESMFSVRQVPWHGLGTIVQDAPTSDDALRLAGLDWKVIQSDVICKDTGIVIPGYKVNMRDTDQKALGMVTDRYKIVQNTEAFLGGHSGLLFLSQYIVHIIPHFSSNVKSCRKNVVDFTK